MDTMDRFAYLTPWASPEPPTEADLRRLMAEQGLRPYTWSNRSFDAYSLHSHAYHKVIYVVLGSITFGLPEESRELVLKPGDRLDLPAGIAHDAIVGEQGVVCLEAHLDAS